MQRNENSMNQQLALVGHHSEITYIESVIQEWGTRRMLCIEAPSGYGKTRLLHEIRKRHLNSMGEKVPLIVTDILDFADPSLRNVQNLGCKIAWMLGERIFEPYLRVLLNWRRMEASGVGPDQLRQAAQAVNDTFVSCFNIISARVVLFLDTVDALEQPDLLNNLIRTVRRLENVVLLVAGRNVRHVCTPFQAAGGKEAQTIVLAPLSNTVAETYIHQKQTVLHASLVPSLIQKIVFFARGNPLILDIAIERYSRQAPVLEWLNQGSASELAELPEEQRQQRQQEFEQDLATFVADTNQVRGSLILLMSLISPIDEEMAGHLLAIPEDTTRTLFDKVRASSFVKHLPDGRICLYEDVRRMVKTSVWPLLDPLKERRKHYYQMAAIHLERKTQDVSEQLATLRVADSLNRDGSYVRAACDIFLQRTGLEQERDALRLRQLCYTIRANNHAGMRMFVTLFDRATHSYDFGIRRKLLLEVENFAAPTGLEDRYDLDRRWVTHLMDSVDYGRASALSSELLERTELTQEQRIDVLLQRGNAEIRLGHVTQGMGDFEHALMLSQQHDLASWMVRAQHARGWAYSNLGRYDLSLADYLDAYQRCLPLRDSQQIAWLLNDISFIHALRGNRQAALESCHAALELWLEMDAPRGLAATYTTLGEIYVRFNQPNEALAYYNKGLDIFTSQHDIEWMSITRCGRAFAFQSLRELEKAEEEQNWVLHHAPLNIRPRILYSQALTFLLKQDIDRARLKLEACRQMSQQIGDNFNDYKSFADLVELAWDAGECYRWREFLDEHTRRYAYREGIDALRLRGSCLRKIADLAICDSNYGEALACYKHALPLIAEYEVHERYTIRSQMKQTDSRLRSRVAGKVLHQLGHDLSLFWQSREELVAKYPEVLLMFSRW